MSASLQCKETGKNIIIVVGEVWKAIMFGLVSTTTKVWFKSIAMKCLKMMATGLDQNEKYMLHMSKSCIDGRYELRNELAHIGLLKDLNTSVVECARALHMYPKFATLLYETNTLGLYEEITLQTYIT